MGALRWTRAALLAAIAGSTGVVAHMGAGGLLPDPRALALLFVALTLGCAMVLVARASAVRVVFLVVAGQTFIHVALTALAGHASHSPHAEHMHATASARLADEVNELAGSGALMALAHLGAAAVIGLWLAYGEAALFELLALMMATVRALLLVHVPVLATNSLRLPTGTVPLPRLHARLVGTVLQRRGPPARLLVTV